MIIYIYISRYGFWELLSICTDLFASHASGMIDLQAILDDQFLELLAGQFADFLAGWCLQTYANIEIFSGVLHHKKGTEFDGFFISTSEPTDVDGWSWMMDSCANGFIQMDSSKPTDARSHVQILESIWMWMDCLSLAVDWFGARCSFSLPTCSTCL